MQVPKLEKIVVSQGLGAATADKKIVDYASRRNDSNSLVKSSRYNYLRKMKQLSN